MTDLHPLTWLAVGGCFAVTITFAITEKNRNFQDFWLAVLALEFLAFWLALEITDNPRLTPSASGAYLPGERICASGCGTPEISTSSPAMVGASGSNPRLGRVACCAVSAILRRPGHQGGRAHNV